MTVKHGQIKLLNLDTLVLATPLVVGSIAAVGFLVAHLCITKTKDVKWLKK